MSHPTCCCSVSLDRCDRCDLLVGLEDFHLMSVARTPQALVLDIESCNQLVGCPGYGVNRSRSRERGGGGDRRALGPGSRQGSGGTTKTDDARACVSSPASRITRGKDHPTARLSGPCPGKVWHRAQELAGRARKRLACGGANRDDRSPSKGQQERHRLAFSKDATSVLVGWAEPGYRGRGELPERCSGRGTSRSCPRPTGVS